MANCGSIELMGRAFAALASLILLAACGSPGAVQARAFTTGFKAGETIRYRVHTAVSGSLLVAAQQVPINSDLTLTQVLHVKSVDKSGSATVEVTTRDVVGDAGGGEFSFSSHNRYLKDEAAAGHDAAVIETSLQGPIDFTIDFSKLPVAAGATPPPAAGLVHYTGLINSGNRYWIGIADQQVLKSTGTGTYRISHAVSVPAGQAGGSQQIDLNAQTKTDLTRI